MKKTKKVFLFFTTALMMASSSFTVNAATVFPEWFYRTSRNSSYLGDLNDNGTVDSSDIRIMSEFFSGNDDNYDLISEKADLNFDSTVNIADYIIMKSMILRETEWISENQGPSDDVISDFIHPEIEEIGTSLKSQGNAAMCIIAVDFPDCKFRHDYSTEDFEKAAFGECNEQSNSFPFESISAFYNRASKGVFNLDGKAYIYHSSKSVTNYRNATDDWKGTDKIIRETLTNLDSTVDFSDFDLNNDHYIDSMLFILPYESGDADWWPVSNTYRFSKFGVDNVLVGNYSTGNVEPDNVCDFARTYSHELGHQLGLPDYYLYTDDDDYEGFHGSGGTELMDVDTKSDLCSFSKLMLGWFRKDQILYFDRNRKQMTFELTSAQTPEGNCLIIPAASNTGNSLTGEYFVVEYNSDKINNSAVDTLWWQDIKSGIRIFHINAPIADNHYWKYFKYSVGSEEIGNDYSKFRLIRLVNDYKDPFRKGSFISYNTPGFALYDQNGYETVDPHVSITIDDHPSGKYILTVTSEN